MPPPRELSPTASAQAFFGAELRRLRLRAGLKQEQLGEQISYSGALVGAVETAERKPKREFAERADAVLGADGLLERLWALASTETYPGWFRPWLEVEREAHTLRSWELAVVPGLLQTADYARELLRTEPGMTEEQVEEMVTARMDRQSIMTRDNPPLTWFVMDEGVVRRPVGTGDVMRRQLDALIETSRSNHARIQVVPSSVGAHPGVNGTFAVASLDASPDVVYLESVGDGHVSDRPVEVAAVMNSYDAIRAEALPVRATSDLIAEAAKQWT